MSSKTLDSKAEVGSSGASILAWVILIGLSLIWGSSFILIKKGLTVYSPVQVAFVRLSASGLVMWFLVYPSLRKIPRKRWALIGLSGLIGSVLPAFLFAFAQTGLSSALTGVLNALTPVFTLVIGLAFFAQKGGFYKIMGISLGFFATIGLILSSSSPAASSLSFNPFIFLVISATICYGLNINITKRFLSDLPPIQLTSLSFVLVSPLAFTGLFFSGIEANYQAHEAAFLPLLALVFLGIFGTGIAMIFFNRMLQLASPSFASSVTYFIPIVAIFWGLIDGEKLSIWQFFCIAGIILGVWLINRA